MIKQKVTIIKIENNTYQNRNNNDQKEKINYKNRKDQL